MNQNDYCTMTVTKHIKYSQIINFMPLKVVANIPVLLTLGKVYIFVSDTKLKKTLL